MLSDEIIAVVAVNMLTAPQKLNNGQGPLIPLNNGIKTMLICSSVASYFCWASWYVWFNHASPSPLESFCSYTNFYHDFVKTCIFMELINCVEHNLFFMFLSLLWIYLSMTSSSGFPLGSSICRTTSDSYSESEWWYDLWDRISCSRGPTTLSLNQGMNLGRI